MPAPPGMVYIYVENAVAAPKFQFLHSCRKILPEKIHVIADWLSRNHGCKSDFNATAPALRQDRSSSDSNQMRHSVSIVVDAINARTWSNIPRH